MTDNSCRALHQPSRNDVNLYRYFLIYFDSQVHAPFLQLHRAEPEHNSWQLRHFFDHIRDCMISLQDNTEEANKIVNELDTEVDFLATYFITAFTIGFKTALDGQPTQKGKEKEKKTQKKGIKIKNPQKKVRNTLCQ